MKDTQFGVYVYGMSYEHSQIRQPLYDRRRSCRNRWGRTWTRTPRRRPSWHPAPHLAPIAVLGDEVFVGLEEVGRARIEELVLGRDATPLVLDQNLEERVEEEVDERALDAPGNDLLLPILPLLSRGLEDVFPALLERLLVLAVEEVVLEELRRRQAHPERVDGVEYLLLVLALGKVDADELDVRLIVFLSTFSGSIFFEEVVVGKDDGRGALEGFAARGADDLFEILPVVLAVPQGDIAGLQDEISLKQIVGAVFLHRVP